MQKCGNCGATLSCGCQRRVATDGRATCTNCKQLYEKQLADRKKGAKAVLAPVINKVTLNKL